MSNLNLFFSPPLEGHGLAFFVVAPNWKQSNTVLDRYAESKSLFPVHSFIEPETY